MKSVLALIFALLAQSARADDFPVRRCINLGGALEAEYEGAWGYAIREADLRRIRAAGFDTVRLPVNFAQHWSGQIDPAFLARVDTVVGQASAAGLNTILDLHNFLPLMEDPTRQSAKFRAIWVELSAHFAGAGPDLIFELMNEPEQNLTTARALDLYAQVMPDIRARNPDRWVIYGGGLWNDLTELDALPEPGPHEIHTFHFYDPFDFTHQQAFWLDPAPPTRDWGSAKDRADLERALDAAAAHPSPVFLGEFGVYVNAPDASAAAWLAAVRQGAEARGIAWCAFSFATTFAFFDPEADIWDADRLRALIP